MRPLIAPASHLLVRDTDTAENARPTAVAPTVAGAAEVSCQTTGRGRRTPVERPSAALSGSMLGTNSLLSLRAQESARASQVGCSTLAAVRFREVLDETTGSKARVGNQVDVLFDGVNSFAERKRLIEGAKHSVLLQTFIFDSDETGWEQAHLLADKARQGVKVKLIYDGLGSDRADPAIFTFMRAAGVDVRAYGEKSEFWRLNNRWHEKLLIVDGDTAVTGGMNIANEYAWGGSLRRLRQKRGEESAEASQHNAPWRDVDVKVRGPIVADVIFDFLENWAKVGTPVGSSEEADLLKRVGGPSDDGVEARFVTHKPMDFEERNTHDLYWHAIAAAKKSITIENAYFCPPPLLKDELIAAAKRGVAVRVMTNSPDSCDMPFVTDVMRHTYDELLEAGVCIYEKHGGTLHAKSATFDGEFSIIGSCNLNARSNDHDTEAVLAVLDRRTSEALTKRFYDGIVETRRVSSEELHAGGPLVDFRRWAVSTLFGSFV